jgi:predicted TIM-barrel fold metal-dependent hydrolase
MSTTTGLSRAAEIRSKLDYPIVDSDGHVLEVMPVFAEYLKETAGAKVGETFTNSFEYKLFSSPWAMSPAERREKWILQMNLWGWPTKNTLDRATATIPALYAKRMDDLGIDYSLLYPSAGLFVVTISDPDQREEVVRAYNRWVMELCSPHKDRMSAVASIPMHTPEEAIRHLEYAVNELGHKVVCMQGYVPRAIPEVAEKWPEVVAAGYGTRLDYYGLDSEYDYDAVWAKCVELKVAPTFHAPSGLRAGLSVSNYTYNHINNIAQAQEQLAKSLFLAGVTRRFPELNFGFLECGAGWACSLFADLVGHYGKRSLEAMAYVDPAQLDVDELMGYFEQYADPFTRQRLDVAKSFYAREFPPLPDKDDFDAVKVNSAEEIVDLFIPRYYIGCEADDRSVALAFNTKVNPSGSKIRAMFGSDVGHWDVTDVGDVVHEAQELVDDGFITEGDFKEFMFWNPVELHARVNPDFFKGTVVENDVAKFLRDGRK